MRQSQLSQRAKDNSARLLVLGWGLLAASFFTSEVAAQESRLIREVIHAKSLEGTATGENPQRHVSVYLPPSYHEDKSKRFAVVYLLHGIGDTDQVWTSGGGAEATEEYSTIQGLTDQGIAKGSFGEMIVVMPDQRTKWFGSFYVNSSATGNWEDFTTRELVRFIDGKYRTLARASSRGIVGHSMGGYGALTLAMKHPDVFSVTYGMNSALIDGTAEFSLDELTPKLESLQKAQSFQDLAATQDLMTMALITVAQAFSPNPQLEPFFSELPYKQVDQQWVPREPAYSQWKANSPIRMVEKYRQNLRKLRGIRFDSGYDDEFKFIPINSRLFALELENNGIEHTFDEYDGDHRNRLWGQQGRIYGTVMPYFWNHLEHQTNESR